MYVIFRCLVSIWDVLSLSTMLCLYSSCFLSPSCVFSTRFAFSSCHIIFFSPLSFYWHFSINIKLRHLYRVLRGIDAFQIEASDYGVGIQSTGTVIAYIVRHSQRYHIANQLFYQRLYGWKKRERERRPPRAPRPLNVLRPRTEPPPRPRGGWTVLVARDPWGLR